MQELHNLSDDQVSWLKRVLNSQTKHALFDHLGIPEEVCRALAERGLVRLWRNGDVEITLAGMVAVAHLVPTPHEDDHQRAA